MAGDASYSEIIYWKKHYGSSGIPDRHAIEVFVEVETDEKLKGIRSQLYSISKGGHDQNRLKTAVGLGRKNKHGSFERWAQLMLLWLSRASSKT